MVDNLHVQTRSVGTFRPENGLADNGSNQGRMSAIRTRAANGIFGDSSVMQALQRRVSEVASRDGNVVIYGESGSGRRQIACAIHIASGGADAPLLIAACSDGVAVVMESIASLKSLGAQATNRSSVPATLVLDGLSDLSPGAQLQILQALGLSESKTSDAHAGNGHTASDRHAPLRIIATLEATDKDDGLLHAQTLRLLGATSLNVPALRERYDDVENLAHYFLALLNSEESTAKQFSGASLRLLREYAWPGNVRELRSVVQRAFLNADLELDLPSVLTLAAHRVTDEVPTLRIKVGTSLDDVERWMIAATLKKCGGNKTRAAGLLGVSLKTLYNRLNAYRAQGLDMTSVEHELAEVAG